MLTTAALEILLVDDDDPLREMLSRSFEREGHRVTAVADGETALAAAAERPYDIVLLDVALGAGPTGHDVARMLRSRRDVVPIIMLTAKDSEVDIVVGLELGADDYVTKPYSARELLARMRAVLRRLAQTEADLEDHVLDGGRVVLDIDRHTVAVDGREINMPLKEFELLEVLMRNAGRVLTRGQLIDRVWGADYVGDTKTLDVHVKRLRAKIEPDPAHPRFLVTVRGLGYKYDAPVPV